MSRKNPRVGFQEGIAGRLKRWRKGTENAMTWIKQGRLGAPYQAPYDVVSGNETYRLRRYFRADRKRTHGDPVVLVPPLMVTSEIYDISPELSAVSFLTDAGLDVWVTDFGRPENIEGGMARTLDDHILAIDHAIDEVRQRTGRDVHLVGYSQGGMFAYQAAAYRRSAGIASILTFGSPVDIHRNLPGVKDSVAGRIARAARGVVKHPLGRVDGLSGAMSSRGFKLANPTGELKQMVEVLGLLHDRSALEKREPKRRFLGGEGFVSWPGPALEKFIDDVIVANRMTSGGLVINGVTTTLHDVTCPIFYILGLRDEMIRPPSVRGIRDVATQAEIHGLELPAGHFGLVVGSRAMKQTWPAVVDWVLWRELGGEIPASVAQPVTPEVEDEDVRPSRSAVLYERATDFLDRIWEGVGDRTEALGGVFDSLRWQIPRLLRLESLHDDTRVNISRVLAEQAEGIGEKTFFIWKGRAFSYREANQRVSETAEALSLAGARRGHHVGVFMNNAPEYLIIVAAVSRLGGVSVLLNTGSRGASLAHAIQEGEVDLLVCDERHVSEGRRAFPEGSVLLSGFRATLKGAPPNVQRLEDLVEAAKKGGRRISDPDAGRAGDLSMLIFTSGTTGLPKAARVSNRRWAMAALSSAAGCHLTPADTVYCCLPLHHSTGMLVAVGGALVGGARLVLSPKFSVTTFWDEVRRDGVTVVFYVGELCRYLLQGPVNPSEDRHPVRLFVGNGLRPHVWQHLLDRFGPVKVLEFYGATEGNVVLANITGEKVGSVGRPLLGTGRVALVQAAGDGFAKDGQGFLLPVGPGEAGVLIGEITSAGGTRFDGYTDAASSQTKILNDVFRHGDRWFNTGDLLSCDSEGDYFFVDRLGDTFRWKGENVSTEEVARVVDSLPGVRASAVFGVEVPGREGRAGVAAIELSEGHPFSPEALYVHVSENLFPAARPRFVRVVKALETTASLKFSKVAIRAEGVDPGKVSDPLFVLDEVAGTYAPLTLDLFHQLMADLRGL